MSRASMASIRLRRKNIVTALRTALTAKQFQQRWMRLLQRLRRPRDEINGVSGTKCICHCRTIERHTNKVLWSNALHLSPKEEAPKTASATSLSGLRMRTARGLEGRGGPQ